MKLIVKVVNAIQNHLGESNIRLRFTDYLSRFVTLAAFQEYTHTGSTKIGYPSVPFKRTANGGILGSGAVFADESIKQRELWANGHRIDAWRRTKSYRYYAEVRGVSRAYFVLRNAELTMNRTGNESNGIEL